jgi:hypothetical protein
MLRVKFFVFGDAMPSPSLKTFATSYDTVGVEEFVKRRRAGATAICADGTYSYSASRQRACSHHGGVAQWFNR